MLRSIRYRLFEAGMILMISICSLMLGLTWKQYTLLKSRIHEHASALFQLIVITRQWNSDYEGVYVTKSEGVTSNPYLENPDITDIHGNVYTKKNPALMTREISEISNASSNFTFHITSLKLMNPDNTPDDWERAALMAFEGGEVEMTGVEHVDGQHIFRLIRPLYIKDSCLTCHGEQGYNVGDVRGGISVNLPYQNTLQAIRYNNVFMILLLIALIGIFGATFYLFIWKIMDALEKQKVQLEVLNRTKNKFLGICAHDLRSPLSVISGYTGLLLQDAEEAPFTEEHVDFLSSIKDSTQKMLELVNTLLDISVIENGHLELHVSRGNLRPFIEAQLENSRIFAGRKNITIAADLHDTPDVLFDEHRMSQMMDNIIGNAIKFSPPDTTVYVTLDTDNGHVLISVRDEGPGIPENEQALLFEDFKPLSPKPTGGETSTGLGLVIVKKIVEYHHGTIEVESHPGKGSIFTVKLPVAEG